MVWNEDYTAPNTWQPANLNVGSKRTTVTVAHRHKPMSGDFINRDESRSHASLKLDGSSLRGTKNYQIPELVFEVEKFDGDGFGCYRLRDVESKKLLFNNIGKDWVRLGEEDEIPEDGALLCFERWEGFKPYMANVGEIAWRLWIKSRATIIHIDSDGWLNSKESGDEALFTFHAGHEGSGDDDDIEKKAGETDDIYFERLNKMMEPKDGEPESHYEERVQAIWKKLKSHQS